MKIKTNREKGKKKRKYHRRQTGRSFGTRVALSWKLKLDNLGYSDKPSSDVNLIEGNNK